MTIPKWAISLIAITAAAMSALVTGATMSYQAGVVLAEMSSELRHLREITMPAIAQVTLDGNRIGVVETRLNYCCPAVAPRASSSAGDIPSRAADAAPWTPCTLAAYSPLSSGVLAVPCCLVCEPSAAALGWLGPGVLLATSRSGAGVRAGAQREESVGAVSGMILGVAIASEGAGAHHEARIASTLESGSTPALATFSTVTTF